MNKPWFLRSKKLGDYSHLRRKEFNELREIISKSVALEAKKHRHPKWSNIRAAALVALRHLARKHNCTFQFDAEGGHICIYKKAEPVFALRIGSYARHRVEDLLKGKALYRGIVDIVSSTLPPLPKDLSPRDREHALYQREMMQELEPLKVLYFLLPTREAGTWKNKEAIDLVDIIGCVKEHPGSSGRYIQHVLNMSPNKTVRLLHWLRARRILHRRGASKSSGWYLN
jgi:hypothetical protein